MFEIKGLHLMEWLGSAGTAKLIYDAAIKIIDAKSAKKKVLVEAEVAKEKVDTEAEVAREKVQIEAQTAKEKRLDEATQKLIEQLQGVVKSNQEMIEHNATVFQKQIDGVHSRLNEETEKRRLSDIFREAAEKRAQQAEEALRHLNTEHSNLELELIVAKREISDVSAVSQMRERTIKSLEARLAECEAKIKVIEKFCRDNNITLPATYDIPKGETSYERHVSTADQLGSRLTNSGASVPGHISIGHITIGQPADADPEHQDC